MRGAPQNAKEEGTMKNYLRLLQLRRTAMMMAPDAGGASGAAAGDFAAPAGADGDTQAAANAEGEEKSEKAFGNIISSRQVEKFS